MQFGTRLRQAARGRALRQLLGAAGCLLFLWSTSAIAADKKPSPEPLVDSGSFAVLLGGRRVGTETFSITQNSDGSSITSHFKTDAGVEQAEQSSDLELYANGDLRRYEWKELGPGQSHAVVEPKESFLIEHEWKNPSDKPLEQPFLLPSSTTILDDYFFVQREVLAWRYLATSCKQDNGIQCPLKQKTQMGTLNAHARASQPVGVEFAGREKISIHGTERELIRLNMTTESGDWSLWIDDSLKLQRMVIPAENTEVVRD
jgi:hypothetical protein